MKFSVKLAMKVLKLLTQTPAPSGSSMSSKTPGRDLEDRWSLDEHGRRARCGRHGDRHATLGIEVSIRNRNGLDN